MKSKLNKDEKVHCLDFLFLYEQEIKQRYGHYNFDDQKLEQFCAEKKVLKKGKRNCKEHYYFCFDTKKIKISNKGKVNDVAHHLLRHIRNSIAHGNIKNLKLYDYNSAHNQTMQAHLPIDFLWDYIDILLNTYKQ